MNNWFAHIIIFTLFLVLLLGAFLYRGREALSGIFWGGNSLICQIKGDFCKINISNVNLKIGMYDPNNNNNFSDSPFLAIDHYFISWINVNEFEILNKLRSSDQKNRWPLITIEPWSSTDSNSKTLLQDTLEGKYDQNINSICSMLNDYNKPVFIRFGHEMENVTGRYPWATTDSQNYIKVYQKFVSDCRLYYSQGYYVWSPVGNNNLNDYFPGKDYVDYIGISIYELQNYDFDNYGHIRSFHEIVSQKYDLVKNYNLPIMIAEIGVQGKTDFQTSWLKKGVENNQSFPLIKIIVYFNSKDNKNAWPEKYGIPDWQISKDIFVKN